MMRLKALAVPMILAAFSGFDQGSQGELKAENEHEEVIYRLHSENYAPPFTFKKLSRDPYPWEKSWIGHLPCITKEHFRCKGKKTNPPLKILDRADNAIYVTDCGGIDGHSLPAEQNQEQISQTLIDLLNLIQKQTLSRVVVTCGHCCPDHNRYVQGRSTSKHLVGAEVDFYVEGKEESPQEIVALIEEDYAKTAPLRQVSANEWINREVKIRIISKNEGRDLDNDHPYAYIVIELLYDKYEGKPAQYSWKKAHSGYLRW